MSSISLDQFKRPLNDPLLLKSLRKSLRSTGYLEITDIPLNFAYLSQITSIGNIQLNPNDIVLFKQACSTFSNFTHMILARILELLQLSNDSLDYYFSEDQSVLTDITNSPDHSQYSVLSISMDLNDTSKCTIHIDNLLRRMSSEKIGISSDHALSNGLLYSFSARSSQTHLTYKGIDFHPSKHLEEHELFHCKKTEGLPDNLAYLYRLLMEVDSILMYHMATSIYSPLDFNILVNRIGSSGSKLKLTLQHLHQINHIRPNSYTFSWQWHSGQFCNFIESKELPRDAELRKNQFYRSCVDYSNANPLYVLPEISISDSMNKKPTKRNSKKTLDRKNQLSKQSIIQFSVKKSKQGSVLERIKAKELQMKVNQHKLETENQQTRQKFIDSHLPNIGKTLIYLAPSSGPAKIMSKSTLMTKISDSVQHSLTSEQLNEVIIRLAEKVPSFCSMSSIGKVSGIRLESGWNVNRLMALIKTEV